MSSAQEKDHPRPLDFEAWSCQFASLEWSPCVLVLSHAGRNILSYILAGLQMSLTRCYPHRPRKQLLYQNQVFRPMMPLEADRQGLLKNLWSPQDLRQGQQYMRALINKYIKIGRWRYFTVRFISNQYVWKVVFIDWSIGVYYQLLKSRLMDNRLPQGRLSVTLIYCSEVS